ncbi:MAG: hypothetical protein ABEN55_10570 [Bradymonadaceae bacterium]
MPESSDLPADASSRLQGWIGLCLLIGLLLSGCAEIAGNIARETASASVNASLEEATDATNRRRINTLLTLRGIRGTGRRLARGMAEGFGAYLTSVISEKQLTGLTDDLVDDVSPQIGEYVQQDLAPGLRRWLVRTTRAVLLEAVMTPQVRRQARRYSTAVTRGSLQAFFKVIDEELEVTIGPELERLIAEVIGPAIATAIREYIVPAAAQSLREAELQAALADGARTVGKNTVFQQVEDRTPEEVGPFEAIRQTLVRGGETLDQVLWMLGLSLLAIVLIVVALGLWLYRTAMHVEELVEESEVRSETLAEMARAVESAEEGETDRAILDRLTQLLDREDRSESQRPPDEEDEE